MELNYKHTAERTHSPLMPLGVFDAVEASSADAGRLTLSQRIKRGGGGGESCSCAFYSWLCFLPKVFTGVYRTNPNKSRGKFFVFFFCLSLKAETLVSARIRGRTEVRRERTT